MQAQIDLLVAKDRGHDGADHAERAASKV
jgi:hypothetical protein